MVTLKGFERVISKSFCLSVIFLYKSHSVMTLPSMRSVSILSFSCYFWIRAYSDLFRLALDANVCLCFWLSSTGLVPLRNVLTEWNVNTLLNTALLSIVLLVMETVTDWLYSRAVSVIVSLFFKSSVFSFCPSFSPKRLVTTRIKSCGCWMVKARVREVSLLSVPAGWIWAEPRNRDHPSDPDTP